MGVSLPIPRGILHNRRESPGWWSSTSVNNFAALKETVKFGEILDMKAQNEETPVGQWDKEELEKFKTALIKVLGDSEYQESVRPAMMTWARTQSWNNTAMGWDKEFSS